MYSSRNLGENLKILQNFEYSETLYLKHTLLYHPQTIYCTFLYPTLALTLSSKKEALWFPWGSIKVPGILGKTDCI